MARQIIDEDIISGFSNNIKRKAFGMTDLQIYGTDFKDSWITK